MHPLYGVISDVDKWSSGSYKANILDFPGGTVDKNPPANAGDTGWIPRLGTRIPHAMGQLSLQAKTTEACLGEFWALLY